MTDRASPIEQAHAAAARVPTVARIALAATAAAGVDLALAWGYWSPHGLTFAQLLHAQARWVLGPHAMRSPETVGIGFATGWMLYLAAAIGVTAALRWRDRHSAVPGSRWHGVMLGVAVYVLLFRLVVPWLAFPVVPDHSPGWTAACLLVHGLLIGPLLTMLLACPTATRDDAFADDGCSVTGLLSRRRASPRTPA